LSLLEEHEQDIRLVMRGGRVAENQLAGAGQAHRAGS
jgi:hypothetical protein